METSAEIGKIAAALAKFQGEVGNVGKDGLNPFFKSKYATLENIINTVREPLHKNGLSFSQFPSGENELATILMHTSGEYIKATAKMTPKDASPQAQGSAITYLRRYALSAILGIATEDDDDGNSASKREPMKTYTVPRKVAAADDEAGGAVIQDDKQFMDEEIETVQKERIKDLLASHGHDEVTKAEAKKLVKELTELDLSTKENWEEIIKRLHDGLDKVDPLSVALKE